MKKKTGHYEETPKIFLDSAALSGRRVQIFHSDGDGVFSSKKTTEMLAEEKIRHEYSAPYDSNTNAFIERARRTIFEGVCTAWICAASFWGEAECHKIFTINVLPTEKDPNDEKNFVSKRNLLEGNRRPFNLERLMAFGTAVTCYIPKEKRKGGKEPAQRPLVGDSTKRSKTVGDLLGDQDVQTKTTYFIPIKARSRKTEVQQFYL